MKYFESLMIALLVGFVVGAAGGCSGDPGDGGVEGDGQADGSVDTGGETPDTGGDTGSVDTGVDSGDDTSGDTGNPVEWPEPGTVEYWLDIVPGVWEQTDPESGSAYCKTRLEPETCEIEIVIEPISDKMKPFCLGADWTLHGDFALVGILCLWADGSVAKCSTGEQCKAEAVGKLTEDVITNGVCNGKSDDGSTVPCARHADCVVIAPGTTCSGMKTEYWLDVCMWNTDGSSSCNAGSDLDLMYKKIE